MHLRRSIAVAAVLAPFVLWSAPMAWAGDVMSSQEIQNRLQKQAQTRGLKLTPSSSGGQTGPAGQAVAAEKETVNKDVKPAAVGAELPPEEQVNLTVGFAFDSAVLLPQARRQLAELCDAMKNSPVERFNIYGHTDAAGTVEYNLTLSKARANEVKRYLVRECGLPASRINAIGVGESRLFDPKNPRAAVNRRVEVQIAS